MPESRKSRLRWGETVLDRRRVVLGLVAVGGFLAVDVGAVLWAGGWFGGGGRLTQQVFINGFKWVNGPQLGFRKNHAKGVAVAGYFDSNGNGQQVSKATVFRPGRIPVQGRFSLAGGNHAQADMAATARGLGLVFGFPGGEQWRTAMLSTPVFPDSSPQGYDRLIASASHTQQPHETMATERPARARLKWRGSFGLVAFDQLLYPVPGGCSGARWGSVEDRVTDFGRPFDFGWIRYVSLDS
jgi:hypothetical protein